MASNSIGRPSKKFAPDAGRGGSNWPCRCLWITDNQRSGDFAKCVTERGNWNIAYEHYGEYQREGGFDGTNLITQAYPEATVIHNANTAMTMGSVEALVTSWCTFLSRGRPR